MKSSRILQSVLKGAAFALLLALSVFANAKDGRDFAGFYHVSNVVEQGDQMLVTLSVQVFNHSDADVKQAVLTLHAHPLPTPIGEFQPVKLWKNHGELRRSQQFLVSRQAYERWGRGAQPELMVVYHDEQGQRYDRYVQMSQRPGLPQ
jgi:hypothetical protein